VQMVKDADCIIVGGASGLSAAGGGDFYYEDNESFRKYFGKFAGKYNLSGAFSGTFRHWDTREEFWAYMATFLNTTQNAPLRKPYKDLDEIIKGKDFFILTTNQDTQFTRIYPEEKIAQVQGDHRFFQCSRCCTDDVWDAIEPVKEMMEAMGDETSIPTEMIPRCPHCGAEAFPWVRGYGNFLTGKKYEHEYKKISDYVLSHKDQKILFIELGVGRLTPMFIQEPFWMLVESLPQTSYISVNRDYAMLPKAIEDRGMAIQGDIKTVLEDVANAMRK
nr:NAD-dependent protein deacetylase [Pseudobutyrivibrio sp.]